MPSKSKSQARLMAGVAHDPAFAAKVGIPQTVGREFNQADAGSGILKGKTKPAMPPMNPKKMRRARAGRKG